MEITEGVEKLASLGNEKFAAAMCSDILNAAEEKIANLSEGMEKDAAGFRDQTLSWLSSLPGELKQLVGKRLLNAKTVAEVPSAGKALSSASKTTAKNTAKATGAASKVKPSSAIKGSQRGEQVARMSKAKNLRQPVTQEASKSVRPQSALESIFKTKNPSSPVAEQSYFSSAGYTNK